MKLGVFEAWNPEITGENIPLLTFEHVSEANLIFRSSLSSLAIQGLDEVWDFIFRKAKSIEPADRFIDQIFFHIQKIAESPHVGVSKDHIAPGLRRFPIPNYRYYIYYSQSERNIKIERVIRAYRAQEQIEFD